MKLPVQAAPVYRFDSNRGIIALGSVQPSKSPGVVPSSCSDCIELMMLVPNYDFQAALDHCVAIRQCIDQGAI